MAQRVLNHEKIKPVWDSVVTEILDCKLDKVTGVRLKNIKTGAESAAAVRRGFCGHRARAQHATFQGCAGHG